MRVSDQKQPFDDADNSKDDPKAGLLTGLPIKANQRASQESRGIPEVFPVEHLTEEVTPQLQDEPSKANPNTTSPTRSERIRATDGGARSAQTGARPAASAVNAPPRHPNKARSRYAERTRQQTFPLVAFASAVRSLSVTFAAAVLVSTIFMWSTSADLLVRTIRPTLAEVAKATALPRQIATRTAVPTPIWFNRIGIIAGHFGNKGAGGVPDPGAVCVSDETIYEAKATLAVAQRVVALLRGRGFEVDLLQEFDIKLNGYQAAALLSIHADSCLAEAGNGFKNAYPIARDTVQDQDLLFDECLRVNYQAITGLEFLPNEITDNMTLYHAFRTIAPNTPANILELGNLYHNQDWMFGRQDQLAQAIVNGIMCYLEPQTQPQASPQIPPQTPTLPAANDQPSVPTPTP